MSKAVLRIARETDTTLAEMGKRFTAAWKSGKSAVHVFTFESPAALFRVLTPKRWELVERDYDVPGFGFFTHLIISAKLPDDLVYKITKTLVNNLPRFADVVKDMKGVTPKNLALDLGNPYHPGALKYYKEIKAF